MPDILPDAQESYDHIVQVFRSAADAAGYGRIDTPIVEDKGVFVRGIGTGTDVVDKEMYVFTDRSDNEIALRPEPTAGIVRAYIQHGMASLPQPVRLQTVGSVFRYDRPQAGRQRQFNQLDVEVIGEGAPSVDAQVIMLALRVYRTLGLRNVTLQVNSIGDRTCRPQFLKVLTAYLQEHKSAMAVLDQERLKTNPLRVLDSKDPKTRKIVADAPQTLNYLCEACHKHFTGVLEYLDNLGVAYELNPQLVRGLDYYSRTVFEFYGTRDGSQSSLGGGGRYDYLVEELGGKHTPAAGFGIGIERVMLELESEGVQMPKPARVPVFVASLGEPARLAGFALIEKLLDGGVGALGAVDKDGIGSQLERANKLGVPFAIIIGQKEVQEETVILRDMKTGAQEMVGLDMVVKELRTRFGIKG